MRRCRALGHRWANLCSSASATQDRGLPWQVSVASFNWALEKVTEPGKIAGWLAPPAAGIHDKPVDFEYVRL